jgi:spermidine synthase
MLVCLFLPGSAPRSQNRWRVWLDVGLPAALGLLTFALAVDLLSIQANPDRLNSLLHMHAGELNALCKRLLRFDLERLSVFLKFGLPVVLCYLFVNRPLRFALGVGTVLLATFLSARLDHEVLHRERSFFGVLQVERRGPFHRLTHGTTLHGMQGRDPSCRSVPLTYYHRTSPIGQIFASYQGTNVLKRVGIIGLGAGTLACYGEPGRDLTFYEIDAAVVRIACNPDYFTYLSDCLERGGSYRVVLGDARLRLEEAAEHEYGLIVIDAFSSDAIPMHLLTLEALQVYDAKLTQNGLLAFHISNRYLDLEPVLGNLAEQAGFVGRVQYDRGDEAIGKTAGQWVVLARSLEDFAALGSDGRWQPLSAQPGLGVWTDDFSNALSVFLWK